MSYQNPKCDCTMCKWVRRQQERRGDQVPLPSRGWWPNDHKEA